MSPYLWNSRLDFTDTVKSGQHFLPVVNNPSLCACMHDLKLVIINVLLLAGRALERMRRTLPYLCGRVFNDKLFTLFYIQSVNKRVIINSP